MIYWFTGCPGSGKTTLALELVKHLPEAIHIDAEDFDIGYTGPGTFARMQSAMLVASVLDKKGKTVVVSVTAPHKIFRDSFKEDHEMVEFYTHTTEQRTDKKIGGYEPPTEDFVDIDTTEDTVEQSLNKILKYV